MKKIALILLCCLTASLTLHAQTDSTEIVTIETATKFSNDQALIDLYNQMHSKPEKVRKVKEIKIKPVHDTQYYHRKATRLKTAAYIVGGTMVVSGIVLTIIGDKKDKYTVKYTEQYDANYSVVGFDYDLIAEREFGVKSAIGVGLIGGGALVGIPCLLSAHHFNKLSKRSVSSATLWDTEFHFKNGSTLDLGFDAIGDQTRRNTTIGLGLRYNF